MTAELSDPKSEGAPEGADEIEASRAPLMDHLVELRQRLVRVLWCIGVFFIIGWFVTEPALKILLRPLANAAAAHGYVLTPETGPAQPAAAAVQPGAPAPTSQSEIEALRKELQEIKRATGVEGSRGQFEAVTLAPLEMILVRLKLAFLIAIAVGFPFIAFQVYAFVAPGLYKKERAAVLPFLFIMPLLFIVGALGVYYYVLPLFADLSFQGEMEGSGMRVAYQAQVKPYYELTISLLTAFGLAFQLPVVLALLARAGVIEASGLRKARKYALAVIMVIAAVMTPPDPVSWIVLGVPLLGLYEAGIWWAAAIEANRKRRDAEDAKREEDEAKREAEEARRRTAAASQSSPALPAGE